MAAISSTFYPLSDMIMHAPSNIETLMDEMPTDWVAVSPNAAAETAPAIEGASTEEAPATEVVPTAEPAPAAAGAEAAPELIPAAEPKRRRQREYRRGQKYDTLLHNSHARWSAKQSQVVRNFEAEAKRLTPDQLAAADAYVASLRIKFRLECPERAQAICGWIFKVVTPDLVILSDSAGRRKLNAAVSAAGFTPAATNRQTAVETLLRHIRTLIATIRLNVYTAARRGDAQPAGAAVAAAIASMAISLSLYDARCHRRLSFHHIPSQ